MISSVNMVIVYVGVFVLGLIVGSFLNVVVVRLAKNKSLTGRSMCVSCEQKLRWYELVPVFSFIIQRGLCRRCRAGISWQYPIVEIVTGFAFLLTLWALPVPSGNWGYYILQVLVLWTAFSVLIAMSAYDVRHKAIPVILLYMFVGLGFLSLFMGVGGFALPLVIDILAGFALPLPFILLWLVSGGKWIGLGDCILIVGMGWFLGAWAGLSAVLLAFWVGAVVGLGVLGIVSVVGRYSNYMSLRLKTQIPFAPFLVGATIAVAVFDINVLLWFI